MTNITAIRKSRAAVAQPLQILAAPGALMNIKTVELVTGLSRATIYRRMGDNTFPQLIKLSARTVRWQSGMISQWLESQVPEPPK